MANIKAKGRRPGSQSRKGFEGRFWEKVIPEPNSGCWIWEAGCNLGGYGIFFKDGRTGLAHRLSYEHFVGKIPDGLSLDHKCRNTFCVNPEHLEPVTHLENVQRGMAAIVSGARMRAISHCPSGHPYIEENIYYRKNGYRDCKICAQERSKLRQRIVRNTRSDEEKIRMRDYWRDYRRRRRADGKT